MALLMPWSKSTNTPSGQRRLPEFLPRKHMIRAAEQELQRAEGKFLDFDPHAILAQFPGAHVGVKHAKANDGLRRRSHICGHTSAWQGRDFSLARRDSAENDLLVPHPTSKIRVRIVCNYKVHK